MTHVDHPALAAALRPATPEMLLDDARVCATSALFTSHADEMMRYRRLAALALAVAEMQERQVYIVPADDTADRLAASDVAKWNAYAIGQGVASVRGPTLPAALAALVEGAA